MTDRMTEQFDTPETPVTPVAPDRQGSSQNDLPLYGSTDLGDLSGASGTVTTPAAFEERSSLGQNVTVGEGADTSAKDHAQAVAQDAAESTKNVASTAASEAKDVANTARTQLRQLVDQLGGEATEQASGQTQRAVQGLRSLGGELSDMAQGKQGQSGMASDLARQGASRLDSAASWLEGRQPGEILEEVRSFARRRPGAFIAGAALLGLIGGRMTRGLTADSSTSDAPSPPAQGSPAAAYGTDAAYEVPTAYAPGAAYVAPTAGLDYGTGPVRPVEPIDLEGTDPTRVDARIDPSTYTHPAPSTGATGATGVTGVTGDSR